MINNSFATYQNELISLSEMNLLNGSGVYLNPGGDSLPLLVTRDWPLTGLSTNLDEAAVFANFLTKFKQPFFAKVPIKNACQALGNLEQVSTDAIRWKRYTHQIIQSYAAESLPSLGRFSYLLLKDSLPRTGSNGVCHDFLGLVKGLLSKNLEREARVFISQPVTTYGRITTDFDQELVDLVVKSGFLRISGSSAFLDAGHTGIRANYREKTANIKFRVRGQPINGVPFNPKFSLEVSDIGNFDVYQRV